MADLGELVLTLRLDDAQYRRDLGESRRLAEQFGRAFGSTQKLGGVDTSRASRDINKFGANAETIITGAFLRIGSEITSILNNAIGTLASIPATAVNRFIDYEQGLNQLAVVTRSTKDDLEGVTDVVRRLGIETSKAPAEVIAAANSLATLGATAPDIEKLLPSVVALSEATNSDLSLSADLIQKSATVFGGTGEELADIITTLRNTSAALPQDLTFLLQNTGQTAANAGVEITELSAAFATLRNAGQNARPAATGLRNVLQNLSPTTDTAKAALDALNLSLIDAQTGEFAGFESFINQLEASRDRFISSGQGLESFNQNLKVLFGKEGLETALALLNTTERGFLQNQAALNNSVGAAQESSAALRQGLSGIITLLTGTVDSLLISFGESLSPVLTQLATIINDIGVALLETDGLFDPLINAGQQLSQAIGNNPERIQELAQGFVNLATSGIQSVGNLLSAIAEDPEALSRTFNNSIQAVNGLASAITQIGNVVQPLFNVASGLQGIIDRGAELTGIPAILGAFVTPINILNGLIGTIAAGFDLLANQIKVATDNLKGFLNLRTTVQPTGISSAGIVGLESIIPRYTGGPVGPGNVYSVAERGPELGFFSGKAALFTAPTILPSPPSGQIFNARATRSILNQEKTPSQGSNYQRQMVALLLEQNALLKSRMQRPMISNIKPGNQQDFLWELMRLAGL